ncbi:RILP-like protein homolog isoform X1 [Wyeomyia smithii]|uniref:RILP-like protein homolog isoform X1 n=1 Tax=Wyeomyia smithii TaxID=174621 RepID=UPI002467EA6E|nr:RILP-like protein homolog isoform X1 [Wyeomyia smithii]
MNSLEEVSVVDIYDLASEIGKEFEKIIDKNGPNSVIDLIPKVINVLELLEAVLIKRDNEDSAVQELRDKIAQLETDKLEKAELKKQNDKEMESIEEQWRSETRDLLQLISRLQNENRRLSKSCALITAANMVQSTDSTDITDSGNDMCFNCDSSALSDLKIKMNELSIQIKSKDLELQEKATDIANVSVQIEGLKKTVIECRRRQKLSQNQIITLFEERADFLAQLQDQQHEILVLRKRLGIAEKENEDLTDLTKEDERPRFSTCELKEVLTERNDLQLRVNDLEQELHACKYPTSFNLIKVYNENNDLPVQGPLPYEPDDAPWKRQPGSGIRKFFRKLFSDVNSDSVSCHKHSVSSLTKIALSSGPHSDIPI